MRLHKIIVNTICMIIVSSLALSCSSKKGGSDSDTAVRDSVSLVRVLPPYAEIAPGVIDKGAIPVDTDTIIGFSIRNIDSIDVVIDSVTASLPHAKTKISRDSISAGMIIAVGLKLKTPSTPGPFRCEMRVYSKGVTKPSYFEMTGEIIERP